MMMYEGFAGVYDTFMDNIPYKCWSEYVISLLKKYGVEKGLVLDMGCGTGNITEYLALSGYDMIGIDNSVEMLSLAMKKKQQYKEEDPRNTILYLLQDMRELELYGTVRAVVSICDSINYIMSEEDLLSVFRLVNNYLDTKGVFIFDLNTIYKYKEILSNHTIAENREDCSFIWENSYYETEQINEYDLTIYIKAETEQQKENDLFTRYEETHFQKAYELDTIKYLLKEAGMEFITAYDAFTEEEPKVESERIYVIAREGRQEHKYYVSHTEFLNCNKHII